MLPPPITPIGSCGSEYVKTNVVRDFTNADGLNIGIEGDGGVTWVEHEDLNAFETAAVAPMTALACDPAKNYFWYKVEADAGIDQYFWRASCPGSDLADPIFFGMSPDVSQNAAPPISAHWLSMNDCSDELVDAGASQNYIAEDPSPCGTCDIGGGSGHGFN